MKPGPSHEILTCGHPFGLTICALAESSALQEPGGLEGRSHLLLLVRRQRADRRAARTDRHAQKRESRLDAAGRRTERQAEADRIEAELRGLGGGVIAAHGGVVDVHE